MSPYDILHSYFPCILKGDFFKSPYILHFFCMHIISSFSEAIMNFYSALQQERFRHSLCHPSQHVHYNCVSIVHQSINTQQPISVDPQPPHPRILVDIAFLKPHIPTHQSSFSTPVLPFLQIYQQPLCPLITPFIAISPTLAFRCNNTIISSLASKLQKPLTQLLKCIPLFFTPLVSWCKSTNIHLFS